MTAQTPEEHPAAAATKQRLQDTRGVGSRHVAVQAVNVYIGFNLHSNVGTIVYRSGHKAIYNFN
jgi:hypothetical protein